MATLTAVVWVVGAGIFLYIAAVRDLEGDDIRTGFGVFVVPAIAIALAINYDLNGVLAPSLFVALLTGVIFLGLVSLCAIFVLGSKISDFGFSGNPAIGLVISILGVVASVLTIISFYLDYLK